MKKYLFATLVLTTAFVSCKKKDSTPSTCDATVAAVAGNYKITKITLTVAGISTDATSTFLSETCLRDNVFQLKADKTLVYADAGTACSPSAAGTGTWDIVSGKITITHDGDGIVVADATITNNCSSFTATETDSGTSIKYTFTKQ